ncbi:F-box/WD40 repeat-containing protein [Endozoicomonas sp. 8E]|uniref:F-box/WD repeat-containing protein n=1 Tax=Endozoicomonas sp. 8E TaxID=3035692 RepID=UPI0029392D38|nr:F-box/WD40 repeat-containing protein [Endozoicomonas sp. 8E]WOG28225.1 F-box/WD40 repeat-containing protein [Endozoicomonas sp. 8E]
MKTMNSNSYIDVSHPPIPKQHRLEEGPTGVSAGRDVTACDQNKSLFFYLPNETKSMIIRYLGFREITHLKKVCRYFRDLIEKDKLLERAWYRQFSSPHQYQLETIVKAKDEQQLRDWLSPFAPQGIVEPIIKQRLSTYFPALLLFNNSKLMSECEQFKSVNKIKTTHFRKITIASFNADGRFMMTASCDFTLKICGQKTDGSWEAKDTINLNGLVLSASFSSDTRHFLISDGNNLKVAKIHVQQGDGSWEVKSTISHEAPILATFSPDGRYLLTASHYESVKIHGQETSGAWEEKAAFKHEGTIKLDSFSSDSRHLLIVSSNNTVTIYGQEEDGSWGVKATISHEGMVFSASFSADSRRLVTTAEDRTAKICDLQDDGSWRETATIVHDNTVLSASFSPDSCYLVTVISGYKVRIFHDDAIYSASLIADSRHLVSASEDNTAKAHNQKAAGSWVRKAGISRKKRKKGMHSATFSPDGRHLAIKGTDNKVFIYGLREDGSWERKNIIRQKGWSSEAIFSPDGTHLITWADNDKKVKIYGLGPDGTWVKKAIINHEEDISLATFSPDGRHVLTVSYDHKARITELRKL